MHIQRRCGFESEKYIDLKNDSGQPKLISDEAAYYMWTPLDFQCCKANIYERGKSQNKQNNNFENMKLKAEY